MPAIKIDVVDKNGAWLVAEIHHATNRKSLNREGGKAEDGGTKISLFDTRGHYRGDLYQKDDGTFVKIATGEVFTAA